MNDAQTPGEQELGVPPLYPKLKKNRRFFGLLPSKKPYIMAYILLENRQFVRYKANIDDKGVIIVGKRAYNVVSKAIYHVRLKMFYVPVSYYYWDNPNPIVYNKSEPVLVNPEIFKDALDSKLVQDVLKPEINALLIIMIVLTAITLGITAYIAYKLQTGGA